MTTITPTAPAKVSTFAIVTHHFSGIHFWPEAEGVHEYLKHPHRHLFHVRVEIEQFHDNRDVEYLLCLDWLRELCKGGNMNHKSCEMMARDILVASRDHWGNERRVRVEVTEDGENGARLEG